MTRSVCSNSCSRGYSRYSRLYEFRYMFNEESIIDKAAHNIFLPCACKAPCHKSCIEKSTSDNAWVPCRSVKGRHIDTARLL